MAVESGPTAFSPALNPISSSSQAGPTPREIADYLGHAQISMTQDVYMQRKTVGGAAAAALEGRRTSAETTG
ncbi:hypothetical protein [Actinosynnema pretiosum]|uniref:hypothetical protein n=1 Tax=Actinosynnema pretiosum TaxID=42197 RepID=UPI0018DEF676|nr:hypothetical protein [Actinosynnema pretiosum]